METLYAVYMMFIFRFLGGQTILFYMCFYPFIVLLLCLSHISMHHQNIFSSLLNSCVMPCFLVQWHFHSLYGFGHVSPHAGSCTAPIMSTAAVFFIRFCFLIECNQLLLLLSVHDWAEGGLQELSCRAGRSWVRTTLLCHHFDLLQ